jgi:predicted AlkP superfamily phosphohydrolase/phosphomutase
MPPLVIVCWDAGDVELLRRWAGEGRLPTLAAIMQDGCWGTTAGPQHVCEHGSWVTTFSGVSRHRHGYYSYRQLVPGEYALEPFSSREAAAAPFWGRLRGTGKRVAVIDAPEALPVDDLDGVQLCNWATHQPDMMVLPPSANPSALLDRARRVFGSNRNIREYAVGATVDEDLDVRVRLLDRVRRRGDLCRDLLAGGEHDLVVIGFFEGHKAAHRFWDYRLEARGGELAREEPRLADAVRDVYESTDREIGAILETLGRPADVVVLSTFGMKDEFPTTGLMDAFMRTLGYQSGDVDGATRSSSPLALGRRLVPRPVRDALAKRLPPDVQERLVADRFRVSTNWHDTSAFAIPSLFTSFIRVNLRGREPQGTVAPGADYDGLLDRLEADLMELVDPVDGARAVQSVGRSKDLFGGAPPDLLPDLFVEWTPVTHLRRTLHHPAGILSQEPPDYLRGNEHSHYGFFAAAGPSVRGRGSIGDVSILDLAPTFLALLGEPATGFEGRVIEAAVGSSTVEP